MFNCDRKSIFKDMNSCYKTIQLVYKTPYHISSGLILHALSRTLICLPL